MIEAFDGDDFCAVAGRGQRNAGTHRHAVDQQRARPAHAMLAAKMCAGEVQVIAQEIGAALSSLPRPDGVPSHWRPMHGDFAPWNLRSFGRGNLFLIDWEGADWAPRGADEVFYQAAAATLGFMEPDCEEFIEAINFWKKTFAGPNSETDRDGKLMSGLSRALANMSGRS